MRAPKPETPYTETEALLAVMNEDDERLKSVLDGLLPGEIRELYQQVGKLSTELWTRIQDSTERNYRPRHSTVAQVHDDTR